MPSKRRNNRHTVDMLFVLALFCTFAVCASLVIAFGAHIYQKTVSNMEDHFNLHTASSYITQKIHSHDEAGMVELSNLDNKDCLILKDVYGDKEYLTYIYEYDGVLKELFVASDASVHPGDGQDILDIKDFSVDLDGQIIHVSITDQKEQSINSAIYLHSED